MGEILGAVVVFFVTIVVGWKLARWIEGPIQMSYYSGRNDLCEECEGELGEIDYWVSEGWNAGDGPPPR